MKKGNSRTTGRKNRSVFLKKCFTLWVLLCFILSMNPVYANRANELGLNPGAQMLNNRHAWSPFMGRPGSAPGAGLNIQSTKPTVSLPPPVFHEPVVPMPKVNPLDRISGKHNSLETVKHVNLKNIGDIGKPIPGVNYPGSTGSDNHCHQGHLLSNNSRIAHVKLQTKTLQTLDSGSLKNVNRKVDLDLTSSQGDIQLGTKLFDDAGQTSVTVNVGGEQKTFGAGSKVTAAEYASILQILGGGNQSLVIDNKGRATGGDLTFDSLTSNGNVRASSLVIPEAVQVTGNFAKNSEFKLQGDLVNYGSIYALSNKVNANKATISAHDLTNEAGGLISSYSNSSLGSDLVSSVDLKLHADDTLTNQGRIESSGDLTLSAATIVNGTAHGHHQSTASVSAENNVFLEASQINNAGSIISKNADVNIDNPAGSLTMDSTGGSVQALNGAINIRNAQTTAKVDTTLTGGDWLSQTMNANSGNGTLNINVHQLTGDLSVNSGIAHINADTDVLKVVSMNTTGDPILTNAGQLDLSNGVFTSNGNPYSFIAGQDIILNSATVINTTGPTNGGDIIMVAGANFSLVGANQRITGASATGGSIFANTGNTPTITSNGTGAGSNAGSIQLIAFSDASGNAGDVFLDATNITAQGGNGGNNGNVTATGRGIFIGSINARGAGTTATGAISLNSFQPTIVGGAVDINNTTGALSRRSQHQIQPECGSSRSGGKPCRVSDGVGFDVLHEEFIDHRPQWHRDRYRWRHLHQ